MDQTTRDLFEVKLSETRSRVLATTPDAIAIELIEHLGEAEYGKIVKISESLVDSFGDKVRFNRGAISKYFNYPKTLPFVVRYRGEIEGFIVGVPLEHFAKEEWPHCDDNLGKGNTIYTYAFVVRKEYRHLGLAKMLKRVFQSTIKRKGYQFISGHVIEGTTTNFTKDCHVVKQFENWYDTGYVFEYYRCPL